MQTKESEKEIHKIRYMPCELKSDKNNDEDYNVSIPKSS